ncbi:MAG TPA: hypothetical protein VK436_08620 [Methanocella sp.]|nr:hypothetical protein [Methanocella sp.]
MVRIIDDSAQSNIDFLFGCSIFLITFLYAFTFVPGLFIPYQAGAVDLGAVAYKTGAVLVEDPGWYVYTTNGEQMGNPTWETQSLSAISRIGLANDRLSPNILSINKINRLSSITDYNLIRNKIGLDGTITYNYAFSLDMKNTLSGKQIQLLNITSPDQNNNVEYMERKVLVDTGKELFVDGSKPQRSGSPNSAVLRVSIANITSADTDNTTFRLFNIPGTYTLKGLDSWRSPSDPPIPLVYNTQYQILKNGDPVLSLPVSFNQNDVAEVVVYNSAIRSANIEYLWVMADSNVMPGDQVDYVKDPDYKTENVCYPGTFKVEVWSDDI